MSKGEGRKPETLFGSGQRNANRKGRGKTKQPTMAEILREPQRLVKNVRVVKRTPEEAIMIRLYVSATKGDHHAARELLEKLNAEARAAIGRSKPRRQTEQDRRLLETMKEVLWTAYGPSARLVAELKEADVLHSVGGQLFIRRWASDLAQEHGRSRWQ